MYMTPITKGLKVCELPTFHAFSRFDSAGSLSVKGKLTYQKEFCGALEISYCPLIH